MPVRPTRLLYVALLGASVATTAFAATQTLTWSGDIVTARGVVEGMASAWHRAGHGRLVGQSFNTAAGIDAVSNGSADIAGSVRGSDGSAEDRSLTFTPVAWDGLVVITGRGNPVSGITLKQLHDIYFRKITNWDQVGGPNARIQVYAVASPGDGVEYSLRSLVFGRGSQPVFSPRLYLSTTSLEQGVALDPHSLGVTTLSSALGNPHLKMLRIDGSTPTLGNVASGRYPLFTPIYLVTRPGDPHAAAVQSFVDFTQSARGKAVLREHHLLPYSEGTRLASLDGARRARILAETGGAYGPTRPARSPIAAPGATYSSLASSEPTSPQALAARRALAERQARRQAARTAAAASMAAATERRAHEREEAKLADVRSSVIAKPVPPAPTSLDHVHADAVTVADAGSRGHDFAHVRSYSYVSADRPHTEHRHVAVTRRGPTYTVRAGETLYSIARRHSVDVAELRRWNHLGNNTVRPGQVLRLSAR
ncbi:substrate-binding domain-containing protein [Dyella sp. A6]|uniref:LysM peptidoglycan-binding domain-containing protein n=1 Tax=Dyella aluminiiresistens TaxID=3069105 RepID=UPI002E75DC6A|nr:substrate-binding domain-containing protein [Dyella sp. A6]